MPNKSSFASAVFALSRALTIIFPVLLFNAVAADIALSVIAVGFIVHSAMQRQWGWMNEAWVRILLLLWFYMVARGLLTPHPADSLSRALPFGRYILFSAAFARWTLKDAPTLNLFLKILCAVVVVSAGDGLIQYVHGADLLGHPLVHDPHAGHIRLSGPFSKFIFGIMLAWLAFPAVLPIIFKETGALQSPLKVIAGIFCALCVLAGVALSGERMALMLTLMGLPIAALLLRLRPRLWLAGLVMLAAALGLLAFAAPAMLERQVASTADTMEHWQDSPYGMLFKSDLAVTQIHPLTGVGTGQFRHACELLYKGDEARINAMCNTHPHNIYLEWLIEQGVIGFNLFLFFVAVVFKDALRECWRGTVNPAFAGFFVAFVVRVWPFMSTTGIFSRWGAPPFWLVLGALLAYTSGTKFTRERET